MKKLSRILLVLIALFAVSAAIAPSIIKHGPGLKVAA